MNVYIVFYIELVQEGGILTQYPGDNGTKIDDIYKECIKGVYSTEELAKKNCNRGEYIEEIKVAKDIQAEMDLRDSEIKEWKEYLKKNPEKDITKKILSKYKKGE